MHTVNSQQLPVNNKQKTVSSKSKKINHEHRIYFFKSRIRETKHLSTAADSSTDTKVGRTMNTQKQFFFFENRQNHPKCKNL